MPRCVVIARSASDDPSTLAARASPGRESANALSREGGSNSIQSVTAEGFWIASRSLLSGARSRDPLARNDGPGCLTCGSDLGTRLVPRDQLVCHFIQRVADDSRLRAD